MNKAEFERVNARKIEMLCEAAKCEVNEGNFDSALQILSKAESECVKSPEIGLVHYYRGLSFSKMKKLEDAEREYRLSLNAYFKNFNYESDVVRQIAIVLNNLGDVHKSMEKYNEALYDNFLEEGLCNILAEKDERQRVCVACTYDNIGEIYFLKGDYQKAIENYSAAIDIFKQLIATGGPDCTSELNHSEEALRKIREK